MNDNNSKMSDESKLIYQAKLSEQAERYIDMVEFMTSLVVNHTSPLSSEARNLLSVAYKNLIAGKRSAWRILCSIQGKENNSDSRKAILESYRKTIESELNEQCDKLINLLDDHLIQRESETAASESNVFYQKMKGDYYRYKAEFMVDDDKKNAGDCAEKAYKEAQENAKQYLPAAHPIRLGLALNFSVFYYEIKNEPVQACELAKTAFDNAIAELDEIDETGYKDATLIMQLLRDNLTLWNTDSDMQGEDIDDDDLENQP